MISTGVVLLLKIKIPIRCGKNRLYLFLLVIVFWLDRQGEDVNSETRQQLPAGDQPHLTPQVSQQIRQQILHYMVFPHPDPRYEMALPLVLALCSAGLGRPSRELLTLRGPPGVYGGRDVVSHVAELLEQLLLHTSPYLSLLQQQLGEGLLKTEGIEACAVDSNPLRMQALKSFSNNCFSSPGKL
jgi:hypothetical protein